MTRRMHPTRRAGLLALTLWCFGLPSHAADTKSQFATGSEDAIRAALVQRLTLFVEWPGWKMDASHPQFKVCLIGSDPIAPALAEAFHDKSVQTKSVVVAHVQQLDKAQDCHLLYIGANAKREVQRDSASLAQAAVLTVSERPGSSQAGQIVGLPRDESRVRIEINLKGAAESRLQISSRLLQLATITGKP